MQCVVQHSTINQPYNIIIIVSMRKTYNFTMGSTQYIRYGLNKKLTLHAKCIEPRLNTSNSLEQKTQNYTSHMHTTVTLSYQHTMLVNASAHSILRHFKTCAYCKKESMSIFFGLSSPLPLSSKSLRTCDLISKSSGISYRDKIRQIRNLKPSSQKNY